MHVKVMKMIKIMIIIHNIRRNSQVGRQFVLKATAVISIFSK